MTETARTAALDLLDAVLGRGQTLEAAIAAHTGMQRLAGAEQAFAGRLALTTIRRLGQIDDLLARALERPLGAKARVARDVLRLGAAQLLFMEIPAHAAVDTSVDLFHSRGAGSFAKLVNAVLRRLSREGTDWVAAQDAPRLNTPDWLWESWTDTYGAATTRAIATAHLAEAPLDLTPKSDAPHWAERLGGQIVAAGSVRLSSPGAVSGLAGFDDGAWWVQDAAARLVGGLVGASVGDVRGKHVIDLCAAPGGKTALLCAAGARVTAVDRSATRLKRLHANLARLGLEAQVVVADAGDWRPDDAADAVLLDAPCSATGTLRRHPDVALGKSPKDVRRLADLQTRLFAQAATFLKPGGVLVYATCSLQPDEGPAVAATAARAGHALEPMPITAGEVAGMAETVTPAGHFRSLPCHLAEAGGMDGFFAARFRKP